MSPDDRAFILIFALALCLLTTAGCGDDPPHASKSGSAEAEQESGIVRSTELKPVEASGKKTTALWFVDKTRDAGITFKNRAGSKDKMLIPESIGQGVMVFDYDNDDDLDIYFANGGEIGPTASKRIYQNSLWRNDGNWKFSDVTDGSGLECPEWSSGAFWTDVDGDGFKDVYVSQLGKNRLFRNVGGSGKFEDVTDSVGGGCESYSTSCAFFDADGDGDLDLYVGNYVVIDPMNPPNKGIPCRWKELNVCCGPRGLDEAMAVFYENVDGKFVDATKEFGFDNPDRSGKPRGSYTLGVISGDFDNDGDQDLYVSVDSRPSLMFENVGPRRFREVGHRWQVALNADGLEQAGMGVTAADVNRDGKIDLFKTHFSHDTNTLYVNSGSAGNVFFVDETAIAGLGGEASYPYLSWGTGFIDFDCDGYTDIFVASGHVYPQAEGVVNLGTSYAQPNQLFMQQPAEKLFFKNEFQNAGPAMREVKVSRGAAFGDFDRDGRVDIVVVNLDDWPTLIRNESDIIGSWIGFELRGSNRFNSQAIGARIHLDLEDGSTRMQEIPGGGGFLGQSSMALHFGLPKDAKIAKCRVVWPDKSTSEHEGLATGAYYRIVQGDGAPKALGAR